MLYRQIKPFRILLYKIIYGKLKTNVEILKEFKKIEKKKKKRLCIYFIVSLNVVVLKIHVEIALAISLIVNYMLLPLA